MNHQSARQITTNNLLKKLYAFTQNKTKASKKISTIHKNVLSAIDQGNLHVQQKQTTINKEISEYKNQYKLLMDQQTIMNCISIYDIYLGKLDQKQKQSLKHKKILKRKEEKLRSKQNSQKSLQKKQIQYKQKMKEWKKQRQIIEKKKKQQEQKRIKLLEQEEQRIKIEKQKQISRKNQQKKRKLQEGLMQMEQKRKKRHEMIKQLFFDSKKSKSIKSLEVQPVPKYIQLEREYLQKQMRKAEQIKEVQRQKRESMQLKIQQLKNHEREYVQKLKQKFTLKDGSLTSKLIESRSEFNVIKTHDEQEQQKNRERVIRRKEFQNKLKNIPIYIDLNKRKQKQIEIDKAINKKKYSLLSKRNLNDEQIYSEFKDFEININPKIVGENYFSQFKLMSKAPKSETISRRNSEQNLKAEIQKTHFINYLQQLRQKNNKKISLLNVKETDELLTLVEKSKRLLQKSQQSAQKINNRLSKITSKESRFRSEFQIPEKIKQKQLKIEVTKSITQKIEEYEQKVYKKVNELKRISQYDDSIKNQIEIDDLCSKVLKAKLDTIQMNQR